MEKKRLVIFGVTVSLILSGCTLEKKTNYDESFVTPVIISESVERKVNDIIILEYYLKAPSNQEGYQQIIDYISTLTGENKIAIYDGTSALTERMIEENAKLDDQFRMDQEYSRHIFLEALKCNPMLQIYYLGSEREKQSESDLALLYPNVTYVGHNEELEQIIEKNYQRNQVLGYCVAKFREGQSALENFNLEEAVEEIKKKYHSIDKQAIIDGLNDFCNYVQNTSLFQKAEEVSEKAANELQPYVEKAIPKVQEAWNFVEPYVEKGNDKAKKIYEEAKPEVKDVYENTKELIKSLF